MKDVWQEGSGATLRTIKVRVRRGRIDPVKPVELSEGVEGQLTLTDGDTELAEAAWDIWAGYDPEKMRQALRESAGALEGVDTYALMRDIHAARDQRSRGRHDWAMAYLIDTEWTVDHLANEPTALALLDRLAVDGIAISSPGGSARSSASSSRGPRTRRSPKVVCHREHRQIARISHHGQVGRQEPHAGGR